MHAPSIQYCEPEDVAAAVAFLISPTGKHITGATRNIDGGLNTGAGCANRLDRERQGHFSR
ncbi:SDR family oxidoreductase [Bosea thiooxidans]|nr:SDR family oxidoreductase [Bosea sp. (in: a-proteobacteria)]